MRKIQIIMFNFFIISLCSYLLYEDYQRYGEFQWVNENAIEDDEELYLNVISVVIVSMGLISILTQFSLKKLYKKNILGVTLKIINGVYGIFLVLIGGIFSLMILGNIENNLNSSNTFFLVISLIILIPLGYLGILILSQILKDGYLKNLK